MAMMTDKEEMVKKNNKRINRNVKSVWIKNSAMVI